MKKKAQITLFVVMALVTLFAFGFLIYVRNLGTGEVPATITQGAGLSSQKMSLESKINFCIEQKTKEAIDLFGLKQSSEKLIRDYVESKLIECIDFGLFKSQGLTIQRQNGFASVDITDRAVIVNVYFPITIIQHDLQEDISRYRFQMPRTQQVNLPLDSNNALEKHAIIITEDRDAELIMQQGTLVTKDGQPSDDFELKIVDKNFDGLSNIIIIGNVVYYGTDGVSFDPPITLNIRYEQQDIPPGVSEDGLVIVWYDQEKDIWKALPSTLDAANNEVSALISHFSYFAIGSSACTQEQTIKTGILFKEECRECTSETKTTNKGIYFTDPNVVPLPDSEGEHFTEPACVLNDWDQDDQNNDGIKDGTECPAGGVGAGDCDLPATPKTYGYYDTYDVGGQRDFQFQAFPKGDSCEAVDENEKPKVKVELKSPEDDDTYWELNGVSSGKNPEIKGGFNTLHAEVYNTNELLSCAEVSATITVTGFGVLSACGEDAEITENCYCGKTNVDVESLEQAQSLYCCDTGPSKLVVESKGDCKLIKNQCLEQGQTQVVLTPDKQGCFCGEQEYDPATSGESKYCCEQDLSADSCGPNCIADVPEDMLTGQAIKDITGYVIKETGLCSIPDECRNIDFSDPEAPERCVVALMANGWGLDKIYAFFEGLGFVVQPEDVSSAICEADPRSTKNCPDWPSCEARWGETITRTCECIIPAAVAGEHVTSITQTKQCPSEPESACEQTGHKCCNECASGIPSGDYLRSCAGGQLCCDACKPAKGIADTIQDIINGIIDWFSGLF